MFASVNHELRTPINIIINCLLFLSDHVSPTAIKWVNIADTSCKFLLSLVNDALDFTQMKMGKFSLVN
jgi:signal transduction histidine kinase